MKILSPKSASDIKDLSMMQIYNTTMNKTNTVALNLA